MNVDAITDAVLRRLARDPVVRLDTVATHTPPPPATVSLVSGRSAMVVAGVSVHPGDRVVVAKEGSQWVVLGAIPGPRHVDYLHRIDHRAGRVDNVTSTQPARFVDATNLFRAPERLTMSLNVTVWAGANSVPNAVRFRPVNNAGIPITPQAFDWPGIKFHDVDGRGGVSFVTTTVYDRGQMVGFGVDYWVDTGNIFATATAVASYYRT